MIMLQLARLSGALTVILIEPVASKREIARKLGADICIDPFQESVKERLRQAGVGRVGIVIECVGSSATIQNALEIAGCKSTVLLFGLTKPQAEVAIKPFELFKKELTIRASYINPYTMPRAVDLINSGRIDVSSMIYTVCDLADLAEVIEDPVRRSLGKYIVSPWMAERSES